LPIRELAARLNRHGDSFGIIATAATINALATRNDSSAGNFAANCSTLTLIVSGASALVDSGMFVLLAVIAAHDPSRL
jgi:hypothetical protein